MMMGSSPVAQLLLMQGADPNIADRHTGTTPLHDAARMGFLDTVEILVQFLADPNSRDNRNCRPIDLAIESGHHNVVAFLQALWNQRYVVFICVTILLYRIRMHFLDPFISQILFFSIKKNALFMPLKEYCTYALNQRFLN